MQFGTSTREIGAAACYNDIHGREVVFLKLKVEAPSMTAFYTFLERNHLDFKRTKQKYEQEVGLKLRRGQSCVS